jgi:hypothetical protein
VKNKRCLKKGAIQEHALENLVIQVVVAPYIERKV